jgi:ubiquinone/menaquinone biosynthesis C-methylase UbiE
LEVSDRFGRASAAGYDRGFGSISVQFIPALLRAARVGTGNKVLDVATGTGIAAEATIRAIGPSGALVATDLSSAMLERARERLALRPNVSFAIGDGQALNFPDSEFDAVLCAMGVMLFPSPSRALSEFRRVLRKDGWAAVSVAIVPERTFHTRVDAIIAKYVPEHTVTSARYFSLKDPELLRSLFTEAGFRDVEMFTELRCYPFSSFAAYFKPIEDGQGPTGQAYVALPVDIQQVVREDTRQQLECKTSPGGPVKVEVELLFGCGRR